MLSKAKIETLFETFERLDDDPKTELNYRNPYTLLVAVTISAQTTDVAVNKATKEIFPTINTPQAMVAFGEEKFREAIKTIGLYRNKAKNIIALSQALIDHHDGQVPHNRTALEALPGVGRKTASVVLNELGIEPAIAVDTHVFRVSHRLGLAKGKTPDAVQDELMRKIPERFLTRAHHWLILHGRYTCVARKPKCRNCEVRSLCPRYSEASDTFREAPGLLAKQASKGKTAAPRRRGPVEAPTKRKG